MLFITHNFVDHWFISKGVSTKKTFNIKFILVLQFLLINALIGAIISVGIINNSDSWNFLTSNFFLITFFGQLLPVLFLLPNFIFFAIKTSTFFYVIIGLLTFGLLLVPGTMGNLLLSDVSKNQALVYDPNQTYSFVVVSPNERNALNESNATFKARTRLGVMRNYSVVDPKEITDWNTIINNTDKRVQYLPTNWLLAPIQQMFQNNYFDNNFIFAQKHTKNNYAFALSRLRFSDLDTTNTQYFLPNKTYQVFKITDLDPFRITPQKLQKQLLTLLQAVYASLKKDLSQHQLDLGLQKMQSNTTWFFGQNQIPIPFQDAINQIFGFDQSRQLLYSFYTNYQVLIADLPSFWPNLSTQTSAWFQQWVQFLWTNPVAYHNVFTLQKTFTIAKLNQLYPSFTSIALNKPPNQVDVTFLGNQLIKFIDTQAYVLTTKQTYEKINLDSLNQNLNNQQNWKAYVKHSSLTLLGFHSLIRDLQALNNDVFFPKWTANAINYNKFEKLFTIKQKPLFKGYDSMIGLFLVGFVLGSLFVRFLYIKKNLK